MFYLSRTKVRIEVSNKRWEEIKILPGIFLFRIEQKCMTFDHDFGYSFPLFSSLLKNRDEKRRMNWQKSWSKVMLFCSISVQKINKSCAFILCRDEWQSATFSTIILLSFLFLYFTPRKRGREKDRVQKGKHCDTPIYLDRVKRHDFFYPFLFPPKKRGKKRREWIAKIVILSHAFLLDHLSINSNL